MQLQLLKHAMSILINEIVLCRTRNPTMSPQISETDALLPKTLAQDVVSRAVDPSSSSSSQTLDIPDTEVTHLQYSAHNLLLSLLVDSVPGQLHQSAFDCVKRSPSRHVVILSYVLQNSVQTISILIAGRLGPDELSAAAFSLMLAFVTGAYRRFCLWCENPTSSQVGV
jgi:multidrug resistance protein, MATE family